LKPEKLVLKPGELVLKPEKPVFKLSVGVTHPAYLLETKDLFTHGSRCSRTVGEPSSGFLEMDSSDWYWSNGIRYHIFDTRPDTEFRMHGYSVGN